jgi:hypothetical protein
MKLALSAHKVENAALPRRYRRAAEPQAVEPTLLQQRPHRAVTKQGGTAMRLRITLGLALLVAAVSVAAVVAGTRTSVSKPDQASTPVSRSTVIPDAFERAVNRAGTMPPDVVDRAIMRRQQSVSRPPATPDAFERAVNRAGTRTHS